MLFQGIIDEVRISKTARYLNEFTPAARHEPDADTLALYHFDEGTGHVLRDASGHGRDGKIVGARWVRTDGSPIPGPARSGQLAGPFGTGASPFDVYQREAISADDLTKLGFNDLAAAPRELTAVWSPHAGNWNAAGATLALSADGLTMAREGFGRKGVHFSSPLPDRFAADAAIRAAHDSNSNIQAMALSPDGSLLAVSNGATAAKNAPTSIKVWNVASRTEKFTLIGHSAKVVSLAFSPDGRWLASGSNLEDGTARLWDLTTGKQAQSFPGHEAPVCVAFSGDGKLLATACGGRTTPTVKLWNVDDGKQVAQLEDRKPGSIYAIAYSRDGRRIADIGGKSLLRIWDVSKQAVEHSAKLSFDDGHALAFSPDGATLAVVGNDGAVHLCDTATGAETRKIQIGPTDGKINDVCFDPSGRYVLTGNGSGSVFLLKLSDALPVASGGIISPNQPIDLLSLVDPAKNAIQGTWAKDAKGLTRTSDDQGAKIEIPFEPPAEYDLVVRMAVGKLIANRPSGVGIGFVVSGYQGVLLLNHKYQAIDVSQLSSIAKGGEETRPPGLVLKSDTTTTVTLSVRKDGIAASADGKPIIDWHGDVPRFSLKGAWVVPNPKTLFVGSGSDVRFEQITLIPLNAPASPPTSAPASGPTNYELDLSATVGDRFAHVLLPDYSYRDAMTIEMFIRPRITGKSRGLFSFGNLYLLQSSNSIRWQMMNADSKMAVFQPIEFGRRIHLAGVIDGNTLRLYADGRLVETMTFDKSMPETSRPIVLGKTESSANWMPFDGTIDEVRISDGARYDKDFTVVERLTPDDNTWALYHCDDGSGDVLKDSSGHGRDGKIVGATWVKADGSPVPGPERSGYIAGPSGTGSETAVQAFVPTGPSIDLFQHIDPAKGGVSNKNELHWSWVEDRRRLATTMKAVDGVLPIDLSPPTNYVLEASVERQKSTDTARLGFGLRSGKQKFSFLLDYVHGTPGSVPWSGLAMVDGKDVGQNETGVQQSLLSTEGPHTIRIEVHSNAVIATVDGRTIVDYRGDMTRLTRPDNRGVKNRDATFESDLWLISRAPIQFTSLTLTPVRELDAPTTTPSVTSPPAPSGTK